MKIKEIIFWLRRGILLIILTGFFCFLTGVTLNNAELVYIGGSALFLSLFIGSVLFGLLI
jgi:uncharacterized membrane protein YedE/YeeE